MFLVKRVGLIAIAVTMAAASLVLVAEASNHHLWVEAVPDRISLPINASVTLTPRIHNPPAGLTPTYKWDVGYGGEWVHSVNSRVMKQTSERAETVDYRVTVRYSDAISATSEVVYVTWVGNAPTPTPVPTAPPVGTVTPPPPIAPTPTPHPTPIIIWSTPVPVAPTATPAPPVPIPTATSVPAATATRPPQPAPNHVPDKPGGLEYTVVPGTKGVVVYWDDVPGADEYWIRWRVAGPGNELNQGIYVNDTHAVINVADYGEWIVRVQACNAAGCGKPLAKRVMVRPAPTPAPTATPVPTSTRVPTATPVPTATSSPTPVPMATPGPVVSVGPGAKNVSALGIENGAVVFWNQPEGLGKDFSGYSVQMRKQGANTSFSYNVGTDAVSHTVTGLDPGMYQVRVKTTRTDSNTFAMRILRAGNVRVE